MSSQDYYQVLGVPPEAGAAEIKEAYRRLALRHHPDRNRDDPQAAERMKRINEAYAVLSDPEKRRRYDGLRRRFGEDGHQRFRSTFSEQDIFRGSDIHQVFEEMARAAGFRGFEEVFGEFYGRRGMRYFTCRRPGGTLRGFVFRSPRTPSNGRRASGAAAAAERLLRAALGRMGVALPEDGADLHDVIRIGPQMARSGGPYAYEHRRLGRKLIVHVPPAVHDGQRIRLKGQGRPGRHGGKDGDLLLRIRVRRPLGERLRTLWRRRRRPRR